MQRIVVFASLTDDFILRFDTNILISALLSLRGSPFRCLALAKEGIIQSVTCQEILPKLFFKKEKFDQKK